MEKTIDSLYVQRARAFRERGYNCAQSVACSFADVVGLDEQTLFALSEAFGGGMGGHKATCGAVSGAVLIVSLLSSGGSVEAATKQTSYHYANEIVDGFLRQNATLVCSELRGEDTGLVLRDCDLYVEDAVILLHKLLQNIQKLS
ncbi:MAG: C-GCAxxG-C-C family protein [Sphaerochaetaceae bacterium]